MMNVYLSCISQICVSKLKGSKNVVVSSNYYLNQIDEDCDYNDDDDGKEDNVDGGDDDGDDDDDYSDDDDYDDDYSDDGDKYIMMKCLSVCHEK